VMLVWSDKHLAYALMTFVRLNCRLGHHIHLPFISSNSRADNNFDLIHCDLWGD
jgi:hypothetical protein